jgi:hypothetical protein
MKTPIKTPDVRALTESIANGENHDSSGWTAVDSAVPL